MSRPPDVSVVIPAFNPGPLLRCAIDSVLVQSAQDLELIVVDDGSSEDLSWVGELPDSRVRFIRQRNRGVSVARNVAVNAARARWIAFLDQDDNWHPRKLERQLEAIGESDPSFCCTAFNWIQPGQPPTPGIGAVSYLGLLHDQHVCLSSVMVSRARYIAVGGHDPLLAIMQDLDLYLKLLREGPSPLVLDAVLVDYRVHDANASRDYVSAHVERRSILLRHAWDARRKGRPHVEEAVARGLARGRELFAAQALDQARSARRSGEWSEALAHGWRSIRWDPGGMGRAVAATARARMAQRSR